MKHIFRFLGRCVDLSAEQQEWIIENDEHRHLKKILKLSVESLVEVFDGAGNSASGRISFMDSSKALVIATPHPPEKAQEHYSLALAALKPGFVDELLPSLIELGTSSIHIYLGEQSEKSRITEKAILRWGKISLAAVKQCKRNHLPEIKTWPKLAPMIDYLEKLKYECIVLDQSGDQPFLSHLSSKPSRPICALIGGEKGFSKEEQELLGARKLRYQKLGQHVLRAYTATIAAASILSSRCYQ